MRHCVRSKIWWRSMHRDYTLSLLSVHSLSGFAGPEEYNHDTYITGSLADPHLFAGHGRPAHLLSGGAKYWREISNTSTGIAVRAAVWAAVECALPGDHVVSLGSRLADQFPGGSGSPGGGAGVGIDLDEDAAWHCGATAFHRLPDTIWSHLAQHFRTHARAAAHLLDELALSGGTVVCIPQSAYPRVYLSTTTSASTPGCWRIQSRDAAPDCSHWQSQASSKSRRSGWPAATTALRMCMWISI